MALPPIVNPVYYITHRQYKNDIFLKNEFFNARLSLGNGLYSTNLSAHYGCVNAVEFSQNGEFLISGGDDKRVLLWSVPEILLDRTKPKPDPDPTAMKATHRSNVFCLVLDSHNEKIFSGGNDDQVLVHDANTGFLKAALPHEKPVYGLSLHPQNDDVIATAGEDGRVLMFDVRAQPTQNAQVVAQETSGFHSVMFNPVKARYVVTANSEEGIALWDCRKPNTKIIHYESQSGKISGISACFDSSGRRVLALRRRLPPVIYMTECETSRVQFYHPQYYNSCTMKSSCFAGERDEYVLSGSDDFNLYMWKVPQDDSEWGINHMVLRGHRSIVNQVCYNNHNQLLASSGVEKIVKIWSTLPLETGYDEEFDKKVKQRTIYSHDDYMSLIGDDRISHDYSEQSVDEDFKMMAFFDSLVQREIEGWDSQTEYFSNESDTEDDDWPKVIAKMCRNASYAVDIDLGSQALNRINQLIHLKKNVLAKLALTKNPTYIRKRTYHQRRHRRKIEKPKSRRRAKRPPKRPSKRQRSEDTATASRSAKYLKRRCATDVEEEDDDLTDDDSLDAPSTSTGIRAFPEGTVFRLIEQDSEEEGGGASHSEGEANNFVNILPTPLNGTRDALINVLEVAEGESSRSLRSSGSSSGSHVAEDEEEEDYELVAAELDSDTSVEAEKDADGIVDVENDDGYSASSDSECEYARTPKRPCLASSSVSDSGCGTSGASTCSSSLKKTPGGRYSDYRKRWARKARRSIRKDIGADSDEVD